MNWTPRFLSWKGAAKDGPSTVLPSGREKKMRTIMISAAAIAGAGILLLTATLHVVRAEHDDDEEKYLFVWAGDQARTNPDFLAVLDFNEHSPAYGNVITTLGLPNPGAAGNEPHHVGLSADGRVLAAGGLLSLLKGQKEVFFFDVSNPKTPRFLSSADPPRSAITDDFYALPGGGFLVTMMGSAMGHAPGRVAEFDRNLNLVAEHPAMPPADGFNPYGISCSAGIEPEICA